MLQVQSAWFYYTKPYLIASSQEEHGVEGNSSQGTLEPPQTHVKDQYTHCFLSTEVVRQGSRRFAAVESPGTSV